jgi:prepilin-type N-terminal cleavage/methylation domain-containing protein
VKLLGFAGGTSRFPQTPSTGPLRGRAADAAGYTVIELLTVMVILGIVLAGLTNIFVSGSKAESRMNRRFQAQQNARLALDRIRKDIHCASNVSPYATNAVTLVLPTGCGGNASWCTVVVAGPTPRYALYRQSGATCGSAGGTRIADYLTGPSVFPVFAPGGSGTLAALTVDFPVSLKGSNSSDHYELKDTIYLRNSTRTTP